MAISKPKINFQPIYHSWPPDKPFHRFSVAPFELPCHAPTGWVQSYMSEAQKTSFVPQCAIMVRNMTMTWWRHHEWDITRMGYK